MSCARHQRQMEKDRERERELSFTTRQRAAYCLVGVRRRSIAVCSKQSRHQTVGADLPPPVPTRATFNLLYFTAQHGPEGRGRDINDKSIKINHFLNSLTNYVK